MITSNDKIIYDNGATGSLKYYNTPTTVVRPEINPEASEVRCLLLITDSTDPKNVAAESVMRFTFTQIGTYTGSGATDTLKFFNAVEQAVKGALQTLNPSATFTIV